MFIIDTHTIIVYSINLQKIGLVFKGTHPTTYGVLLRRIAPPYHTPTEKYVLQKAHTSQNYVENGPDRPGFNVG